MAKPKRIYLVPLGIFASLVGCQTLVGIGDYKEGGSGGSGAGTSSTGTTTSTSTATGGTGGGVLWADPLPLAVTNLQMVRLVQDPADTVAQDYKVTGLALSNATGSRHPIGLFRLFD